MFRKLVLTHLFMSCLTTNEHQSFADGFVTFRLLSSFFLTAIHRLRRRTTLPDRELRQIETLFHFRRFSTMEYTAALNWQAYFIIITFWLSFITP